MHRDGLSYAVGHGLECLAFPSGHLTDALAPHFGVDPSGANRIAGNPTRCDLDRNRSDQSVDACLACAVRGLSRRSEFGQDAADRDEPPGTAHESDRGIEQVHGPQQVRLDNFANEGESRGLAVLDSLADPDGSRRPRVGDDDIETPPSVHGALDGSTNVCMVPHIAGQMASLSAPVGNLAHGISERPLVAPGQKDANTERGEVERDGLAYPLATARDDGHVSLEPPVDAHDGPASTLTDQPAPTMTDGRMSDDQETTEATSVERARLRGRRWAHALVIGVAAAFIGSSAWQIASAVFGLGVVPVADGWATASARDRACASGLRALAAALDRAGARASAASETATDDTPSAFRRALSPEWDAAGSVSKACAGSREGLDAWAALERLKFAQEQVARRIRAELEPLRRDLATHLPQDLR